MLDIKVIRQDPERVKQAVRDRQGNLDKEVDELLAIDVERREIISSVEELIAAIKQNAEQVKNNSKK